MKELWFDSVKLSIRNIRRKPRSKSNMSRDRVHRLVRFESPLRQLLLSCPIWLCPGSFILNFIRLFPRKTNALYSAAHLPMADLAENDEPVFACFAAFGAFDLVLLAVFLALSPALSGITGMFDHCRLCRAHPLGFPLQFHGSLQALFSTRSKLDYHDVVADGAFLRHFSPPKTDRGRCR